MMLKPVSLLLFLLACSVGSLAQSSPHRPGEFLISLAEKDHFSDALGQYDPGAHLEKVADLLNIWKLNSARPEDQMLDWLRKQPSIRSAQFNHLLDARGLPNDPLFPQQWQWLNTGANGGLANADLDADQAWDISTGGVTPAGDTIVIAVIDGGIQYSHPDLAPNLWHNGLEIPNNNIDDDLNGFKDDYRGWNVFAQSDDIEGNSTLHGTPVSAILGARGNNNLGVTGVNWQTQIMFVAAGGTEAEVLAAYDYVWKARQRYNESWGTKGAFVVAVNCSWGINFGQPSDAPLWCEAFDQMGNTGILSVAATANLPVDVDVVGDLPTACPSNFLISVTSLNSSDQKAANAAWGQHHVDLGAYGQEVYTAAAGSTYGYFSGTSFASPEVTGAVGLLYSAPCPNLIALAKTDPGAAAYWAKSLILDNVTANNALSTLTLTGGRLNLYRTLLNYQNLCSDCPPPFALKTEAITDTTAVLLWTQPSMSINQHLRWRRLGAGIWNLETSVTDSFKLSGLIPCNNYEFEVQAVCENGITSGWSQPFIFKSTGCCATPGSIWLEKSGDDFAKIAWTASSYNNQYRLRWRVAGATGWQINEPENSYWEFADLLPCTEYEVQVQARCEDWLTPFSALFSFTTKGCGACNEVLYCPAKAGDATEEWISGVQLGPWLHESGPGGNGFQNFSFELSDLPVLNAGAEVPVILYPGFSSLISKEYFRLYVDYNQDGDFSDSGELAFDPGFALEGPAFGVIHVPNLLQPGISRLRVIMKYTTPNDTPPEPCGNFNFGQVEDYCVELKTDSLNTSIFNNIQKTGFSIYPQPALDGAVLDFSDGIIPEEGLLIIRDMMGRLIQQSRVSIGQDGLYHLVVQDWKTGIYTLQFQNGKRIWGGKLIKG